MKRNQTVRAIRHIIHQEVSKADAEGTRQGLVISASGRQGQVQFDGSRSIIPVELMTEANAGDRCILTRVPNTNRWQLTSAFSRVNPPQTPDGRYGEMFPPSGLTGHTMLPDTCLWTWNAPVQKSVIFEVQVNTSASSDGAITELMTRGSQFLYSSEVPMFARVRSIGAHFEASAWTDWEECIPGESVVTVAGSLIWQPLIFDDDIVIFDHDIVMVQVEAPY